MKLAQHNGYMGGLQSNGSTGEHAVYYADASTELMFHISTQFNHEENMNIKGNSPRRYIAASTRQCLDCSSRSLFNGSTIPFNSDLMHIACDGVLLS